MSLEERNMVPLPSERCHRLHGEGVPEVTKGLVLKLRQHLETKKDLTAATICFRCLYRLEEHKTGRPDYPNPITWGYLEDYTAILEDEEDEEGSLNG